MPLIEGPMMVCPASPFDAATRQARRHVAAEGVVYDDRRYRIDDGGRHHVVPRRLIAVEELRQRDRHGHVFLRGQQQELIQILVPCQQQRVGADGDQRR